MTSNPLAAFTRLSSTVFLREPSADVKPRAYSSSAPNPPNTILLLGWMDASPRNISKYITSYTALYPTARIIYITSTWPDFVHRTVAAQRSQLKPAVDVLRSDPDSDGNILLHLFSNGGSKSAANLASVYLRETGRQLGIKAMVLDSAPGRGTINRSVSALTAAAPKQLYIRLPIVLTVYIAVVFLWYLAQVGRPRNVITRLREDLNDPKLIRKDAPRCYVYSETDRMVWWEDVEDHAREAERMGSRVEMEKFVGSGHAAHLRVDEQRYWGIVKKLWEQR